MKVLIVEDDENKGQQLCNFLRDGYSIENLEVTKSLQSGLKWIRKNIPDLLLLDMTLPTFDAGPDDPGGTTHYLGGREFLRQMDRFGIYVPTVVVTQFETFGDPPNAMGLEQLNEELLAAYPKIYIGAVYYHPSLEDWKFKLRSMITKALERHSNA